MQGMWWDGGQRGTAVSELTHPDVADLLALHCVSCRQLAPLLSDDQLAVAQHALLQVARHHLRNQEFRSLIRRIARKLGIMDVLDVRI